MAEEVSKEMEREADLKLSADPNHLAANRVKARACFNRNQMGPALRYGNKGIPISENGEMEVVLTVDKRVDVKFAALMRELYINEGKFDEAIEWCELYANHFPVNKTAKQRSFLKDLEGLKAKKNSAEQNAKELLEEEADEKKKTKKKGKEKVGTSLNEVEEEKQSTESEDESYIGQSETNAVVESEASTELEDESYIGQSETTAVVESEAKPEGNWTSSVTYQIFMKKKFDNFVGSLVSEDNEVEDHSFVEASDLQLAHYKKLKELGSMFAGVLYVEKKICGPEGKTYFVVEPVKSVDSIFLGLIDFATSDKAQWWRLIAEPFKQTFREIMESLQLLYSKGLVCGDLSFGSFVTPDGRVKLLPSMNSKKTAVEDLQQLISKMKAIIGLPFNTTNVVNDPEFDLPPALRHFLVSYRQATPQLVPWILKAPFFWSRDEEFYFLEGMSQLVRSNHVVRRELEYELQNYSLYQAVVWKTVLDGPYQAIWAKGDPNLPVVSPVPDGCFQIVPYRKSCDIYRYLCAVKKHINEGEYDTLRTNKAQYDEDKISSDIKGYYPDIYTDSHKMIYDILRLKPWLIIYFIDLI